MITKGLFVAAALGSLMIAVPAQAQPNHCPPGHEKKGWCTSGGGGYYLNDDYRQRDRERLRDAYEQGYRDGQRAAYYNVGERFTAERDRYRVIDSYDRYGLRRPPQGYYYAEVDGRILLIQAATQVIAALVNG